MSEKFSNKNKSSIRKIKNKRNKAEKETKYRKNRYKFISRKFGKKTAKAIYAPKDENQKEQTSAERNRDRIQKLMSMTDLKNTINVLCGSKSEEISAALSNLVKIAASAPDKDGLGTARKVEVILRDLCWQVNARLKNEIDTILPEYAPELYQPRKSGKASDFLKTHWQLYIDAGICFRPDIKRLDPKLEQALTNEFRGRTDELRTILPNQSDRVDARIERELGGPVRPEGRKAAQAALSFAKQAKQR